LSNCQRLIERAKQLPALRKGDYKAADADERIALATLCVRTHPYYTDAVELYRAAFAERSALAERHRHDAARAFALAGCGKGEDADKRTEAERAAWRKQALAWLRVDLDALRRRGERGSETLRGSVRGTLRRWQSDPAFAGLRDAKALSNLAKDERQAWRDFWDEVYQVLESTAPMPWVGE
jgi:hypothetical protein